MKNYKVKTLTDKYNSTVKIYPKVIEECLPEGIVSVEANPTLAGTEAGLTGIQVGNTKYKVEQPITIVANPDPAGETELTGLQIGETKYKIGEGKQLYQHNVSLLYATSYFISVSFISDSATPISSASALATYLNSKSFSGWNVCLSASGAYKKGSVITPVVGLCAYDNNHIQVVHCLSGSNDPNYQVDQLVDATGIGDRVITL